MRMNHAILILLAMWFGCSRLLGAEAGARINVLLIVVDDMNADLGCYGNPVVKSPNLDRLAERGVRFDRAYCQYALCNPSRVSFLSGRRPETSGVYSQNMTLRQAFPDAVTLPQFFRENGYFSAGAGKVYHNLKGSDPRSWDSYQDGEGEDDQEKAALKARYNSGGDGTPLAYALDGDGSKTRDGINARTIAGYLAEKAHAGKPFFLALGCHKPHLPWTAPGRFFDLYPPGSIPEPESPPMRGIPAIALQTELSGCTQPESRTKAIAGYYACVSFTDDNLHLVLDELDRQKLWDTTVVAVIGDNGFHLGDHGGLWSKQSAFENATRVPFIIAGAGVPRGKVVTQAVELLDLYPTLAELCGITAPPGLEGKSLVPWFKDNGAPPRACAYSIVYHYDTATGKDILGRSVRTSGYRYTTWANERQERELYLSGQQSAEFDNQADNPQAKQQRLEGEHWLLELKMPKPGTGNREPPP